MNQYRALIIFTNQRTGSSNLCEWFHKDCSKYIDYQGLVESVQALGYKVNYKGKRFLNKKNDYKSHEILDEKVGLFRHVIQKYKKEKQKNPEKALKEIEVFVKTLMSYRPTFKIMTEYTPIEICKLIIKYIDYYNYSSLLLYRENVFDRCKSLHFSLTTDIYSTKDVIDFNPENFDLDLSKQQIRRLIHLQNQVNENNKEIWKTLKNSGCKYASISYENLFFRSDTTLAQIVFKWLLCDIHDFESLRKTGKTSQKVSKYYNVKNIDQLEKELIVLEQSSLNNWHIDDVVDFLLM